jgi:hypothetical protein
MRGKIHGAGGSRYHHNIYLGLLIFVVVAGLPIVGLPSLRYRLRDRIDSLRSAAQGKAVAQAASAKVGENLLPFPKEYERVQVERPPILPKFEVPQKRPYIISAGGDSSSRGEVLAPVPRKADATPKPAVSEPPADANAAPAKAGTEYRKGNSEKEAYDILIHANQTLAGLVNGSDPSLKFQDWSAAVMGQDSFNVSLSFVQTADNGIRKYVFNVKVQTKEVMPLSAYAREISK